ncbi:MAG: hypothetical protein ACYTXF_36995 [Nostoc sp.]
MVSKQFSFRLPDEVVEWLEGLQLEGESLNQTTQRFIIESSRLSTALPKNLSTDVDIKELVKQEVAASLGEVRSQLEELRGKSIAR